MSNHVIRYKMYIHRRHTFHDNQVPSKSPRPWGTHPNTTLTYPYKQHHYIVVEISVFKIIANALLASSKCTHDEWVQHRRRLRWLIRLNDNAPRPKLTDQILVYLLKRHAEYLKSLTHGTAASSASVRTSTRTSAVTIRCKSTISTSCWQSSAGHL